MSRHQNGGQIHSTEKDNKAFENMAKFRYYETRFTSQKIRLHFEENERTNLGNNSSQSKLSTSCIVLHYIVSYRHEI
jgi:hypothetical protein